MSLSFTVYCKQIPADIAPRLLKRLNDLDMVVDVHPDFSFDEEKDAGFVPFRFRLKNPHHDVLQNKELKSGFELYIDDFDLDAEKESLKPRLSFFDKLRGKKQPEVAFAPPEVETRLKACSKAVSFVAHAGDSFEYRFAALASALLAELTNGVRCYTADDIWYTNTNIVAETLRETIAYETSIPENELAFHAFDQW